MRRWTYCAPALSVSAMIGRMSSKSITVSLVKSMSKCLSRSGCKHWETDPLPRSRILPPNGIFVVFAMRSPSVSAITRTIIPERDLVQHTPQRLLIDARLVVAEMPRKIRLDAARVNRPRFAQRRPPFVGEDGECPAPIGGGRFAHQQARCFQLVYEAG